MNAGCIYSIYNFRTGEYDHLSDFPQDWSDYIPQSQAAQQLYKLYIDDGLQPAEAAARVLSIAVGKKAQV